MIWLLAAALDPIRRATWCRWFHNWRPEYGGWVRTICVVCSENWPEPFAAVQDRTEEQG